jgi:hypothetical protein
VGALALVAAIASSRPARAEILFGDLHVHTTYSVDAFVFSLPFLGGEGAHPPDDACDFARYCAHLDFFSLNDHAEGLTPELWASSIESIRQCNARFGSGDDPELISFLGWEWTQVGPTPETHYGHKNVVLRGLDDDDIPARPITALSADVMQQAPSPWVLRGMELAEHLPLGGYGDFLAFVARLAAVPTCPTGVDVRDLPTDCREDAQTPRELFEKLDQWDVEALVIPHGLAWGIHAPRGARLDNQLAPGQHDPDRQRLLEVFSGHGNSEKARPWEPDDLDVCPEPTADFLPCCWRAGEIMRARCGDLAPDECERRVAEARRLALRAGINPHLVFPDTDVTDWLDCDQCRTCFKPVYAPRPGVTAQYALALARATPDGTDGNPAQLRWGLMASSDDHKGRAGSGYKQVDRRGMTDARGFASGWQRRWLRPWVVGTQIDPQHPQPAVRAQRGFAGLLDLEREASFLYPGGLVAVHAAEDTRDAVWEALERRHVYGTSGPRIRLWFDLLNGPDGRAPMGSEVTTTDVPRFQVRVEGARVQLPGCPEETRTALSAERVERLCRGECYNPGDERHRIAAIEVIRVRPQLDAAEPIASLIEDPWRRFECPPDPGGCGVEFDDADYPAGARSVAYYVRALQEPTPAINGANLRPERDADGNVSGVRPCYGDYRTPSDDDCLAPVAERAWSSPIWVDPVRRGAGGQ